MKNVLVGAGLLALCLTAGASNAEASKETGQKLSAEVPRSSTTEVPTTTETSSPASTAAPTTPPTTAAQASPQDVPPAVACQSRPPASEELFVRETDPATTSFAYDIGGGWVWNFADEECISGMQFVLDTVPLVEGYCVEVAPKSANPGYNPNLEPAPALRGVVAVAGDC